MKKNLLFIMHESPIEPYGGMGQVTAEIAKRLAEKYNVTVFGFDTDHRVHGAFDHDGYRVVLAESTCELHNHNVRLTALITEDIMTDNIFMYLKDTKFDLIHLCDSFLYKTAKHLSIRDNCPIVTTAHLSFTLSRGVENVFSDYLDLYAFNQEAHAYIRSSYVTAVSNKYVSDLEDIFPQLQGKIAAIPNGLDLTKYENRNRSFTKDYCKTDKPIIGFVGRCADNKGIDWVCAAIRMFPEYHFLVISSCNNKNNTEPAHLLKTTEATCPNMTWERDIRVYDEKKFDLMAGCQLALMPSQHEPWGIVANEWQALGVPLIATSHVQSLAPGTFIRADAESDMLQAIRNHTDETTGLALDYVKTLSWDSVIEKYVEVYETCLTKSTN